MGYAIRKDGLGWRSVNGPEDVTVDELYSDAQPSLEVNPQIEVNAQARAYLTSTDWYIIRLQENGTPVPQDILDARQAARDSVVEI